MNNGECTPNNASVSLYLSNLRLNRAEFGNRRLHLESMPLYLSVVLGTACNIDCAYCYQARTNEVLIPEDALGEDLCRELSAFYPYLSTLRIGGLRASNPLVGGNGQTIEEVRDLSGNAHVAKLRAVNPAKTSGLIVIPSWF